MEKAGNMARRVGRWLSSLEGGVVHRWPGMMWPARILAVLAGWFVLAFLFRLVWPEGPARPSPAAVPRVKVVRVEAVSRPVALVLKGLVEPARFVVLRPRTEGYIREILCRPGDRVTKGQVLAVLTTDQREIQLAEAEAEVRHKAMEFEVARSLARERLQSKTRLAQAQTALEQSRLGQKKARLDMEYMKIVAPFSGTVGEVFAKEGTFLSPLDPSTRALELAEMNPLHVVAYVTEKDFGDVRRGMQATAHDARGRAFQGEVWSVCPVSDEQTRSYKVEVRCLPPDFEIPQGATVDVSLMRAVRPVLALPLSALVLDDQGVPGLRVVDSEGVVHSHPVTVLSFGASGLEVDATGLPAPLDLVTAGHGFVCDGQKVDVEREAEPAQGVQP